MGAAEFGSHADPGGTNDAEDLGEDEVTQAHFFFEEMGGIVSWEWGAGWGCQLWLGSHRCGKRHDSHHRTGENLPWDKSPPFCCSLAVQ